jgi:hypothetical protein
MTIKTLLTGVTFLGAGFIALSARAPYVAAGSDAHAEPRDCHGVCADRFAECDKHAGPREEHDRCGKERVECDKGCDHR